MRIDDLDTARVVPDADTHILKSLESFHLHWDDRVVYQSQQLDHYEDAITQLTRADQTFPCACTRQQIGTGPYPGTCRHGLKTGQSGRSLRIKTSSAPIHFHDARYADQTEILRHTCGDFVIRRADNVIAYHLANVVDDAQMGITEVVRGVDLLDSTARQIHLQRLLGYPDLLYCHLPLIVDQAGKKLGKSQQAQALPSQPSEQEVVSLLFKSLVILQLEPPRELLSRTPSELLDWGTANWKVLPADSTYDHVKV